MVSNRVGTPAEERRRGRQKDKDGGVPGPQILASLHLLHQSRLSMASRTAGESGSSRLSPQRSRQKSGHLSISWDENSSPVKY